MSMHGILLRLLHPVGVGGVGVGSGARLYRGTRVAPRILCVGGPLLPLLLRFRVFFLSPPYFIIFFPFFSPFFPGLFPFTAGEALGPDISRGCEHRAVREVLYGAVRNADHRRQRRDGGQPSRLSHCVVDDAIRSTEARAFRGRGSRDITRWRER